MSGPTAAAFGYQQRQPPAAKVIADNGGHGGVTTHGPLRGSKGMIYEGGIREPMLVRWPAQVKAGSQCDTPVCGIDFYPTFLAAAGLKASSRSDRSIQKRVSFSGTPFWASR